jgi:hypothetical protein
MGLVIHLFCLFQIIQVVGKRQLTIFFVKETSILMFGQYFRLPLGALHLSEVLLVQAPAL